MRGVKEKDLKHVSASPDTGIYKRDGKLRDKIDKMKRAVTGDVVYLSPKTKKPLKRVVKGQKVLYAYKKDGKITVLHPHAQTPDHKLKRWVQNHIDRNGDKAFALYEQRGREILRDKDGNAEVTKTGRNRRVSKLAIPSTVRQQRAVLFRNGKRVRNIEFTFHRHSKEALLSRLLIQPIRPTGRVVELNLMGETITDSLRSLVVDKSLKRLKKWERIFFEWIVLYRDPETGEKRTIPGHGSEEIPRGMRRVTARPGDELGSYFFRERLSRIASLSVQLGHSIRTGLAHQGLRFTSLKKMTTLETSYEKAVKRAEEAGDDDLADKIQGILDRIRRPWLRGPESANLRPIFDEKKDGGRKSTKDNQNRVRIKLRFTIEEDLAGKRLAEMSKRKGKRKSKRETKKGRK